MICKRCYYIRQRQYKSGTGCPRCGYKPLNFTQRCSKAVKAFVVAFKDKPTAYRPRPAEIKLPNGETAVHAE